jgi:hypothetical protein
MRLTHLSKNGTKVALCPVYRLSHEVTNDMSKVNCKKCNILIKNRSLLEHVKICTRPVPELN